MGAGSSCCATMFGGAQYSRNQDSAKSNLERKLYIAKESPEPTFDLSNCGLKQVPSGIYSICKVYRKDYLYLNDNNLETLENGGQLTDLYLIKLLNVSSNKFVALPTEIQFLVNLTELYVQNNYLKKLPDCIKSLKCLKVLDASNNRLKALTPSIGHLKNLTILKILGNTNLTHLCSELCLASNITTIELDWENFVYPPKEVTRQGTQEIMKYLCNEQNVEYQQPIPEDLVLSDQFSNVSHDPFRKHSIPTWEEQEASMVEQENKHYEAAKLHRERVLTQFLQNQSELDGEISRVQVHKDTEKQRLLKSIQDEEQEIECLVKNFIQSTNLKPEVIQQQLQHEQAEHDHLLSIVKQNYDNVKKSDIFSAMEKMFNDNWIMENEKRHNEDNIKTLKYNMKMEDLQCADKLEQVFRAKEESRSVLVQQLLEDQDFQKAVVSSLIEQVDARSWSLNQEISIISSNLARLSTLEKEKKNMHIAYNFNELLNQRMQLVDLLDDLMNQKNKRRTQLLATLKEMESQSEESSDFWLKNYQRVVESAPKTLLDMSKKIDPLLANHLLQEGVIHCLPFLVKFLFSNETLWTVTSQKLKENGVTLSSDRDKILKAIESYISEKNAAYNVGNNGNEPSAPEIEELESKVATGIVTTEQSNTLSSSECVICMDSECEMVFVPCGHVCCCQACSEKDMLGCPMCRGAIERKIKIIVA